MRKNARKLITLREKKRQNWTNNYINRKSNQKGVNKVETKKEIKSDNLLEAIKIRSNVGFAILEQ